MTLLSVCGLHTHFVTRTLDNRVRTARALNGVSFDVAPGQIVGLVGETGAGKSLVTMSILGLLRPPARIVGGSATFAGEDLLAKSPREMNRLRGNEISLVVQSPKSALDPLTRIGDQLTRIQRAHGGISRAEARRRALKALNDVGIPDPERRMRAWPHEMSGGMAQRVLMALALVNRPKLLIADEPTTGLDVTVQAQILDLLRETVTRDNIGMLIITHDLGVVAQYCDEVQVMYSGRIVEGGAVATVFSEPAHPYTRRLLDSVPERLALGANRTAPSLPPNLFELPEGCAYRDRCARSTDRCLTEPTPRPVQGGRAVSCHHPFIATTEPSLDRTAP